MNSTANEATNTGEATGVRGVMEAIFQSVRFQGDFITAKPRIGFN